MSTLLIRDRCILKHHLGMLLRTNSHILLAEVLAMSFDVGILLQTQSVMSL
jgi:hypothetical protein